MNTIAAISTATGTGGIGIIRMSGKDCFKVLKRIFRTKEGKEITKIKGYTIKYGYIVNEKEEKIDYSIKIFEIYKNLKSKLL